MEKLTKIFRFGGGSCVVFDIVRHRNKGTDWCFTAVNDVVVKVSESKEGSFATNTFRGLHGAFIVADIAKPETFHSVGKFRQVIDEKVSAGGLLGGDTGPSPGPASCTPSTRFGYPLSFFFRVLYGSNVMDSHRPRQCTVHIFQLFMRACVFSCASRLSRE